MAAALTVGLATVGAATVAPSHAIDRKVTRRVQPASVQLGPIYTMKDKETGRTVTRVIGWGSGTILDSNGYILTNAHVTELESVKADFRKDGAEIIDGELAVFMTKRSDEPAIPVFVAKIMGVDEDLDIAVVKITSDFSGHEVDPTKINFPSVPLGDSDTVELGDTLNIFGYPGIGGDTITYTSGPVSGFAAHPNYKGRAWIKTSAAISGGNSGGTGVDDDGNLVGIPTRVGVEGAGGFVDCRQLADTNRDGKIDDADTCVPAGGFLNSLRAINAAKALIAKVTGAGGGGGGSGTPPLVPPASGGDTAPTPTTLPAAPSPPTTVPAPQPAPAAMQVRVVGQVLDAATGRGIDGAYCYVLMPGMTWATSTGDADKDLYAYAVTDANGYFEFNRALTRGAKYSVGFSNKAKGFREITHDGIMVPSSGAEPIQLTVKLDRA